MSTETGAHYCPWAIDTGVGPVYCNKLKKHVSCNGLMEECVSLMEECSLNSVICTVTSKSNPKKTYEIRVGKDGVVYCTCPRWKYTKNCKHLEMWKKRQSGIRKTDIEVLVARAVEKIHGG